MNADAESRKAAAEAATEEAMKESAGRVGRGKGNRACSVCHEKGHKAFRIVNGVKVVTCKTILEQEARATAAEAGQAE